MIIDWDVTKRWSISQERGNEQKRDQCQIFSLGHKLCHSTVDCSQRSKKWPSKSFITFGMSPGIGLFHLKLVFKFKETSAKISVLVTILWIKSLSEAEDVKIGLLKFPTNLAMSPQIG